MEPIIRKAKISEVKKIQSLVNFYAAKGDLLSRSLNELYESIRDFFVCEIEGEIVGTCALHINWEDLAEIRSLAVKVEFGNRGIGTELARKCLEEAAELGITKVFALSYKGKFFEKLGFKVIDKSMLPQKVWSDCLKCVKFPECDETAFIYYLGR